jgi:raffinose/stachyose/melibiose transport system permease protein
MNKKRRFYDNVLTYLGFAGPASLVFLAVIILPFLYGLYVSVTNSDALTVNPQFIGLANYKVALNDAQFWSSFVLSLKYVVCTVILTNVIAFLLAYLLTSGMRGQSFFRMVYFTPYLIGGIVLGVLWKNLIFMRVFPFLGDLFKIPLFAKTWFNDPEHAFWALVIGFTWQYIGYMMMIYIAGFTSIPHELLEAASIDGANSFNRLKHITLPFMVTPIIITTLLSLQRSFMVFDVNYSLTGGEPYRSTVLVSLYVYDKAFRSQQPSAYGIGQSEAFFLCIVVAVIAVTQYYFSKKLEVEE